MGIHLSAVPPNKNEHVANHSIRFTRKPHCSTLSLDLLGSFLVSQRHEPFRLVRSPLEASASEDKTLDLEQLVDKIEAPTCPNVVPKMHPSA